MEVKDTLLVVGTRYGVCELDGPIAMTLLLAGNSCWLGPHVSAIDVTDKRRTDHGLSARARNL
jgi:hypothetical protein